MYELNLKTALILMGILSIILGSISLYSGNQTNTDYNRDADSNDQTTKNIVANSVSSQMLVGGLSLCVGGLAVCLSLFKNKE